MATLFATSERAAAVVAVPSADSFVVVADRSVSLAQGTEVASGNVGVNDSTPNVEVELGVDTQFADSASVFADTVRFDDGVALSRVITNQARSAPSSTEVVTPFSGPVASMPGLPGVRTTSQRVNVDGQRTLAPGEYGDVRVRRNSTLLLSGGEYHFNSVKADSGGAVLALDATRLRIADRLVIGRSGRLAPSESLPASSLRVGIHGKAGASFGPDSSVRANVVTRKGSVSFGRRAEGTGLFRARHVATLDDAVLRLDVPAVDPPDDGGSPQLVVDKSGPATAEPNEELTYTLVVTNTGDAAAEDVTLTDVLPTTGTFVSSTPALTPSSGQLALAVGTLAASASRQLTVRWRAPATEGTLVNGAVAGGAGLANVSDSVSTTIDADDPVPSDALIVDVQAPAQVQVTQDFDIDVVVTNESAATVQNASVVITLPSGHFLGVDPKTAPVDGKLTVALGTLAADATRTIKVHWRPTNTGTLTSSATVSATSVPNATDQAVTIVGEKPSESLEFHHAQAIRMTNEELPERMGAFNCAPSASAPAVTFATALADARAVVVSAADEPTRAAMKADLVDARDASRMAGVSLFVQRPAAGLGILLEAYDREPTNPDHLLNAAAFLVQMGFPSTALGFLAETERVGGMTSIPLGIPTRASLLTTRAAALIRLGDFAAAKTAAEAATALAPKSSEAQLALANALHCVGQSAAAVMPYRAAINPESLPTGIDEEYKGVTGVDNRFAYAISEGQPGMSLPSVVDFDEIDDAAAVHKRVYDELNPQELTRIRARSARAQELHDQAVASGLSNPTYTRMLQDAQLRLGLFGDATPPLKMKRDAIDAAFEELDRVVDYHQDCGDGGPWCRSWGNDGAKCRAMMIEYHEDWRQLEQAHTRAIDAYLQAAYPYWQGIVANYSDPITREMLQLFITGRVDALYSIAHGPIGSQANFVKIWTSNGCVGNSGVIADSPPPSALDGPTTSEACDKNAKRINFVADMQVVKVKSNCEKFSVEGSLTKWKWMSAFARFDAGRSGISFYLGTKIATSASLNGFGGAASFESGLYLKFDKDLKFKDVGWRVGPKASATAGPIEIDVFDDRMDLSFVGSIDYLTGG